MAKEQTTDGPQKSMEDSRDLPCLALRGAVVFPGASVPLEVGREKSVLAVQAAAAGDGELFVVCQRDPRCSEPRPQDLYLLGTVVRLRESTAGPDGLVHVAVEGLARAQALAWPRQEPYLEASVRRAAVAGCEMDAADLEALLRTLRERLARLERAGGGGESPLVLPSGGDPGEICDFVAARVFSKPEDQQQVLEACDVRERLERLHRLLIRAAELREVERQIGAQVRRQMERTQREYYLREQLKAIHQELGDSASELDELRQRLAERRLPEAVAARAQRELDRFERMAPLSAEAAVTRTYIDWLLVLPWEERTPEVAELATAERVLESEHYGQSKLKERILEYLALRQLVERFQGPILCLVGPPGAGKTSLGRSIARALGRRLVRASLGGVHDEAEVRGHRRTYVGALPGRIIQGMRQAGAVNPVFLLDELDKLGSDYRGDPAAALLEVLDPEQNQQFSDHYIELPFDLSQVFFITTANSLQGVPRPLVDRLEVLEVPGYSEEEKLAIAHRHLLPRQRRTHGLEAGDLRVSEGALRRIIQGYTHEAGVRGLERQLAALCRKAARRRAAGRGGAGLHVIQTNLPQLLGRPDWLPPQRATTWAAGIANGLAWTESGGEVLTFEVATMPGHGGLALTGRMGEVMRESAQAALAYVRANASSFGLEPAFHEANDVHVHVPLGAVAKDGPSAGVTLAAALVSALTGMPLRADLALTGEITLLGRVMAVGGIKEKCLAARRGGMRTVVLPAANRDDWLDLPVAVRTSLEPVFVDNARDAIACALPALAAPASTRIS